MYLKMEDFIEDKSFILKNENACDHLTSHGDHQMWMFIFLSRQTKGRSTYL